MTYSVISPATPRPRDSSRTIGIDLDSTILVPKSLTSTTALGFGELISGYVAPRPELPERNFSSEAFRELNMPTRRFFQKDGNLYVPTQADPEKLISTNPNIPVSTTFRGVCCEFTTIIKTRTDTSIFTAESYKIAHFVRLMLSQLEDRTKKDILRREKNHAMNLLQTIEEVHRSGRVPEGFEQKCKNFYDKIMSTVGTSVLDDAVISALSWERRTAEPIGEGRESFPYNEYPFSCRCWILGIAFSLLK